MSKISQDLLSQLHDATVRTIVVDYATGAVTIGLRLSEHGTPAAELRALDFTALRLPRSEAWGAEHVSQQSDYSGTRWPWVEFASAVAERRRTRHRSKLFRNQ